jgi:hypothetical protein
VGIGAESWAVAAASRPTLSAKTNSGILQRTSMAFS